jgi:hypothetical protein
VAKAAVGEGKQQPCRCYALKKAGKLTGKKLFSLRALGNGTIFM